MEFKQEKTKVLLISLILCVALFLLFDQPLFLLIPGLVLVSWNYIQKLVKYYINYKAEQEIPDFLYQVSTYLSSMDLIESIGKTRTRYLDTNRLYRMLKTTNNYKGVFDTFCNDFPCFRLVSNVFIFVLKTGKESRSVLKDLADTLKKEYVRSRELEIGMLLEKYTLLIGGGILVPFILGIMFQFSQNLEFPDQKQIDYSIFYNANVIYLAMYGVIVGIFLGDKNKVLYVLILIFLSELVFYLSMNFHLI